MLEGVDTYDILGGMRPNQLSVSDLIQFEDEMAAAFERSEIKAPLHLSKGNEQQLIDIFKNIGPNDWVCGSWRSHYHCLLKGVPREELKDGILDGRSIGLCFPKQKVICSAIVGGIMPIALGIAWAIKRQNDESPCPTDEKVWCFIGDMTAQSGIAHECMKYSIGHELPITWVTENNGKSVCTDTNSVWGDRTISDLYDYREYTYNLTVPHVGTGRWVSF